MFHVLKALVLKIRLMEQLDSKEIIKIIPFKKPNHTHNNIGALSIPKCKRPLIICGELAHNIDKDDIIRFLELGWKYSISISV